MVDLIATGATLLVFVIAYYVFVLLYDWLTFDADEEKRREWLRKADRE